MQAKTPMLTPPLTSIAASMEPGRQGAVRPPIQRCRPIGRGSSEWGSRCKQRWGTEKKGTLLVFLENLLSQVCMAGWKQVQEGGVTILMNSIGGEGALVHAQTLADHPALHPRVKAILQKHLAWGRSNTGWYSSSLVPFYWIKQTRTENYSLSPAAWVLQWSCVEKPSQWHNRMTKNPQLQPPDCQTESTGHDALFTRLHRLI